MLLWASVRKKKKKIRGESRDMVISSGFLAHCLELTVVWPTEDTESKGSRFKVRLAHIHTESLSGAEN